MQKKKPAAKAVPTTKPKAPAAPATIRVGLVTALGNHAVVLQEMAQRGIMATQPAAQHLRGQTLVLATVPRDGWRGLFDLRTVEDVLLVLYEALPLAGERDLTRIEPGRLKRHLSAAAPFHPTDFRRRADYVVFVKQDEDRRVYRKQIADTVAAAVKAVHPNWFVKDPAEIEFWAFYVREKLTLGLRLTDIRHRQRTWRGQERPGSLRPTLAATLIALSDSQPDDVFLDPMCGSGTILVERGLWGPVGELVGGDMDEQAVKIARQNTDRAGLKVKVGRWDAAEPASFQGLEGRVDRLVCNLPFGIQHGKADVLPALYARALKAWRPLLSPRGAMILLTSRGADLRKAAGNAGLHVEMVHKLFIQGIWAEIFALEPL